MSLCYLYNFRKEIDLDDKKAEIIEKE